MDFRLYLHPQIHADRRLYLREGGNVETHAMPPTEPGWLYQVGGVPPYPLRSRLRPFP